MVSLLQNKAEKQVSDFRKYDKTKIQVVLSSKEDFDMCLVGLKGHETGEN